MPDSKPNELPPQDPNSKAPDKPLGLKSYDELNELADQGKLTDEALQAELQRYQIAIQQEFEDKAVETPDNVEEHLKDFFRKAAPLSATQLVWLAHNASSESVRLSALKFVLGAAIEEASQEGDPIKELLKDLQKKPAATKDELAS